nr:acyl carrier protein [uncultured Roseateles sp.]
MAVSPIEDKFFGILSSLLTVPRDRLDRSSSRETVEQWDSLKHMHLVMALEEEFGIEFDDSEISELADAAGLLDAIAAKGGA